MHNHLSIIILNICLNRVMRFEIIYMLFWSDKKINKIITINSPQLNIVWDQSGELLFNVNIFVYILLLLLN